MCTAVFAFLESAKPFFQYGKPLQELLPFFVRALGGILPLDALAIVRMEGKKGVCETACWSGTPHLPEALMLRAFNGKEFPKAFDTPFSEEALAALFPEETAGKLNWLAVNIMEVKTPDTNAQLVAENIAAQLERRISFRRAMKQVMGRAMRLGVKGIKTAVAGRVGGAEIARTEQYHEGTIPLQTLRADIDYGFAEAHTTYGILGVKVWIYKGEILNVADGRRKEAAQQAADNNRRDNRRRGDRRPKGGR